MSYNEKDHHTGRAAPCIMAALGLAACSHDGSQPVTSVTYQVGSSDNALVLWTAVLGIVSLIALFRPELTNLYGHFFRRRSLVLAPSGRMEVAYSFSYGSNISLKGTIESINRDSFVTSLYVTLSRDDSGDEWTLHQQLFRDARMQFQGQTFSSISEVARAFKIPADETRDYYVTFVDMDAFVLFTDEGSILKPLWDEFSTPRLLEYAKSLGPRPQDLAGGAIWDIQNREMIAKTFESFMALGIPAEIRQRWLERFIWEPGNYTITLHCVVHEDAEKPFWRSWRFFLAQPESQRLRSNIDQMLKGACGVVFSKPLEVVFKFYEDEAHARET